MKRSVLLLSALFVSLGGWAVACDSTTTPVGVDGPCVTVDDCQQGLACAPSGKDRTCQPRKQGPPVPFEERDAATPDAPPVDARPPDDVVVDAPVDAERDVTGPCGNQTFDVAGLIVGITPSTGAAANVKIVWSRCPATATSNARGEWGPLAINMAPGYFRSEKPGFHPTLSGELLFPGNVSAFWLQIAHSSPASAPFFTAVDPTKAIVLVSVGDQQGTCERAGWSVQAVGHPEADIRYIDKLGASVGTATNDDGLVVIQQLTPGPSLEPTATHPTSPCKLNFQFALQTGKAPLVAGAVTVLRVRAQLGL